MNRHGVNTTERYPGVRLPGRAAARNHPRRRDGRLPHGKPDFALVQSRDKTRSALKIRTLSLAQPATYIAFDLLYEKRVNPCCRGLCSNGANAWKSSSAAGADPHLVLSQGIVGAGTALFAETCRQHLEGIMAKKLTSIYRPGHRAADWIKIKHHLQRQRMTPGEHHENAS